VTTAQVGNFDEQPWGLSVSAITHRWLQPSDPRVLALFSDQASLVARGDIITALVAGGMSPGSAEVWTVRCSWLRPSGRRGQYILAGRQDAGAILAASA
jgi:hypothetical protein